MGIHRKYKSGTASSLIALAVALLLHVVFLFIPLSRQSPAPESSPAHIELQLTAHSPPSQALEIQEQQAEAPPPPPETDIQSVAETNPFPMQPSPSPAPQARPPESETELPVRERKPPSAASILAAQFITEESEAEKIFGKAIGQTTMEFRREFHFPARQNLISMLDEPLPELPFTYTPGLVHFAYEPGFKGDLQRFWDVITPEFGWRTDNGTEFRCVWVLVVMGCGWK